MSFISDEFLAENSVHEIDRPHDSFRLVKRGFDILAACTLLVLCVLVGLVLLVLNPIWNNGPLLYSQKRMGKGFKPFIALKFRSMTQGQERSANGELELDRITHLGRLLRACRADELPQAWNILKGEMSLVGPRPDYLPHAEQYMKTVPGYGSRYKVRPGLTGLAQVSLGYIDSLDGVRAKVAADLTYIQNRSLKSDFQIVGKTFGVIFRAEGK